MPSDTTRSGVLGSFNLTNVNINSTFQNGWATLAFLGTNATTTGIPSAAGERVALGGAAIGAATAGPVTFLGLPVTGFMIRTFANGGLTCAGAACQGNYGALFNHSYRTVINP
jgi:hypothetical protein